MKIIKTTGLLIYKFLKGSHFFSLSWNPYFQLVEN